MIVLSLFDGISGGRIALQRAGVTVTKYFASEIDKYAIQASQANWSDITQLGDVCSVSCKDGVLSSNSNSYNTTIDLLIAGSPCQSLSQSGDGSGFEGKSKLFWEFVRILKETKPKYFFLENVKMKKEWSDVITKELGVEPILINSSLVSAQNRNRLYWTNIPNITQPQDKGIVLEDILEDWVETKASPKRLATMKPKAKVSYTGMYHIADATDIKGNESIKSVYHMSGKAPTLTTMSGGHREPKVLLKNLTCTKNNKAYTLTASYSGAVAWNSAERKQRTMVPVRSVTDTEDLATDPNTYGSVYYRKLTPLECERLQTLPDNYTSCLSNSQRYKSIGNGWTIDVIAHIFKGIDNVQTTPSKS